jgi:fructokinase
MGGRKVLLGSIEAGGTKFVCSVGTPELEIIKRVSFPTTTPSETLALVIDFFQQYAEELQAIGIGSFGPIDIRPASPTYGHITTTPKLAWKDFDFLGTMTEALQVPIAFTTDVNAAAYGEYVKGHGQGLSSIVYYTIGTGVGGGAIQQGQFIEGFSHPEMGHILVRQHPDDHFEGACPYHQNCLEGLAAGPALEKRFGVKGQDLPVDHEYWEIEAYYIAQCAITATLQLSPERIIFGGGVMQQEHMVQRVRAIFKDLLNDYVKTPDLTQYIVTPALANNAGTIGCLALARERVQKA